MLISDADLRCCRPVAPALPFKRDFQLFAGEHVTSVTVTNVTVQAESVTNVSFGESLRELIELRGISATDLAKAIGVSHVAIGNYCKGRVPHGDILIEIADYFGVDARELVRGKATRKTVEAGSHRHRDVANLARQLDDIKANDPKAFEAIKHVVATYHKKASSPQKPSSSKPPSDAAKLAKKIAESDSHHGS